MFLYMQIGHKRLINFNTVTLRGGGDSVEDGLTIHMYQNPQYDICKYYKVAFRRINHSEAKIEAGKSRIRVIEK